MRNKSPRVRISRNDNSRIRFEKIMTLEVWDIEYIRSTFNMLNMKKEQVNIGTMHYGDKQATVKKQWCIYFPNAK